MPDYNKDAWEIFKEGQEVWWFCTFDNLEEHPMHLCEIHLRSGKIKSIHSNNKMVVDGVDGVAWYETFYANRDEAINAMINKIEGMKMDLKTNSNEPLDVVVNGFSIRHTILSILEKYLLEEQAKIISDEITNELSTKMRLRQGMKDD